MSLPTATRGAWSAVRVHLVAAVLGGLVGLVSVVFLAGVLGLQTLLWHWLPGATPWLEAHRALITLTVCAVGGVLVGLVNRGSAAGRHEDEGAHDLDSALAVSSAAPPRPSGVLRLASLGVLSLGFGASLGPEAPLIAVVAGLAGRLSAVLRTAREDLVQLSLAGATAGLFGAPLGAASLPVEGAPPSEMGRRLSMLGPSLVAALTGLGVVLAVLPSGSLHPFSISRQWVPALGPAAWWCLVAGVLAAASGAALHAGVAPSQRLAARLVRPLVPRAVLGGLVLGVCGVLTPLSLFSGHHETQVLLDEVGERTAWALLAIGAVKVVAVLACLATGWFGGDILPAAMVGALWGLIVADLSGTPAVAACVAAGMVACAATVMRRPVTALLFLAFYLPTGTLVPAAAGAAVAAVLLAALAGSRPEQDAAATAALRSDA